MKKRNGNILRILSAVLAAAFVLTASGFSCPVCSWADDEAGILAALEALDYNDPENWAYFEKEEKRDTDVFLICPTVDTRSETNAFNLNDKLKAGFLYALDLERGIYEETGRLFSPYYRQMSINAYRLPEIKREQAKEVAYHDVSAAFRGKSGTAVGYFYHNTAECSFDLGKERRNYWHRYASYTADAGDIDLFLIAGPEIRSIISRYTDLTGKSVLLPKAALGYLASSMYYAELPENCDEGIMSFLDTAKAEGFPVDGFHLSSGYCAVDTPAGLKRCSFTWNRQRFKDPALWFSAMEKRGILVSPNVKPGMLLVHPLLEQMKKDKLFVRADPEIDPSSPGYHEGFAVGTWWGGKGLFTDFTSPEARAHWKEYLKDGLLSYGCKSVWNDNCEYDSMTDKDAVVCFEGKGSTTESQYGRPMQ